MKKILCIVLSTLLCCFLFAACTSASPAESPSTASASATAQPAESATAASDATSSASTGTTEQLLRVDKAYYNSSDNEAVVLETVFLEKAGDTGEAPSLKEAGAHQLTLPLDATVEYSEDYGPTTTAITPDEFVKKFDANNAGSGMMFMATITPDDQVTNLTFYYTE